MTIFSSIFRLSLFFALIGSSLNADEYYNYFEMACDPISKTVTLNNVDQWNERPSEKAYTFKTYIFNSTETKPVILSVYRDGECTFSNGKKIRLRIGSDIGLPYGECGAKPPEYFSLWVDKKKILSKATYMQRCQYESEIKSIKIQNDIITTCTYATTGDAFSLNINKNKVSCSTKVINMNQPRDEIEYPLVGTKVPAGTRILQYGSDNPVCQTFASKNSGKSFTWIEPLKSLDYGANQLDKLFFDINNDGNNETVFMDSRWGRFEYSRLYVIDAKNVSRINTQYNTLPTEGEFTEEHEKKFDNFIQQLEAISPSAPESWGANKNPERLRINTIKQTIDMPHNTSPVMYKGKVYLKFYSNGIEGLLKYKSSKHFEEICIAKVVEENY
ncbi:MAG TPA: hypothetical protein VJA83_07920 [Sulfuricurvum sp.]|nr:hypothetical protein [Sulfuricurvum sp.]